MASGRRAVETLRGLHVNVALGRIIGLVGADGSVGADGAGKSTLMHLGQCYYDRTQTP